jgi:sulfotransferase
MSTTASPKIFFQSSLPRAGSTLFQNIIAQNPDFYATPTSGALELVFGARISFSSSPEFKAQDTEQMRKAFLAFGRGGLESYYRSLTDKPFVMDKSRGWGVHYDLLSLIFDEEPKIICMVRDLRQILASMEKKFRQNPEQYRASENHQNNTGNTTIKRALSALQGPPIGLALDRLAEIRQRAWNEKMLFIRYEDLTAQPKLTMEKAYAYLGLKYFEHDFEHVAQITQEDDQIHGIPGLHLIRPKVQRLSDDYMAVLGVDTIRWVQNNYACILAYSATHPLLSKDFKLR